MKLTIKVILVLLVLAAIVTGASYQLPKQSIAEQTITVQAKPEQVYAYLDNPTEWVRWNAWNKSYDPTMIQLFGGPMRGAGARMTWNGDKVGHKQLIFTKSESPAALEYELTEQEQLYKTIGRFELTGAGDSTVVHWKEQTDLQDTPLALARGAWQQFKTENQMEQGLAELKTLVQQNSKRRANR